VEKVKPIEAQRLLLDDMRAKVISFGNIVHEAVNESELLTTKLEPWLKTEEEKGWANRKLFLSWKIGFILRSCVMCGPKMKRLKKQPM